MTKVYPVTHNICIKMEAEPDTKYYFSTMIAVKTFAYIAAWWYKLTRYPDPLIITDASLQNPPKLYFQPTEIPWEIIRRNIRFCDGIIGVVIEIGELLRPDKYSTCDLRLSL